MKTDLIVTLPGRSIAPPELQKATKTQRENKNGGRRWFPGQRLKYCEIIIVGLACISENIYTPTT